MRKPRPTELAARIEGELRRLGTTERAAGAKSYLKSDLAFLGADTAALRGTVKSLLRETPELDRAGLLSLVKELWPRGIFELRAAAVELLMLRSPLLEATDLSVVERLLRDSHTWALVDALAVHVAGPLAVRFPGLCTTLDRWAEDTDFWVRRAAMLALILPIRRGEGDFERFSRYADRMLEEKEFFIRKAIGWVLRETAKRRPELVVAWLGPRTHRASGVTVREAVRYVPKARREALLAAQRERRPTAGKTHREGRT